MQLDLKSGIRHARWVRVCHWIITLSFLTLAVSGFFILMVHPRLYWGEVGNDLTPAIVELPVSRNYKHTGWTDRSSFFDQPGSPVTASRTYHIFNQNGWGRSLHFLAGWFLVLTGTLYLITGLLGGHFRRRMMPARDTLSLRRFWREVIAHIRAPFTVSDRMQYNLLQKMAYLFVIFILMPVVVLTGFAMSPAIAAAFPGLVSMWGGTQSARTLHFAGSTALELFLIVHLIMVMATGFRQNMKAIVMGK